MLVIYRRPSLVCQKNLKLVREPESFCLYFVLFLLWLGLSVSIFLFKELLLSLDVLITSSQFLHCSPQLYQGHRA
jgi:hypothetical protein